MKKSLNFDLDTNKLKEIYPNKSYTQAYSDIKSFLVKNDFEHTQGSGYISKEDMSELKVVSIIKDLNKKYPWLKDCCKTLHYSDIGKSYDGLNIMKEKSKKDFVENLDKNDNSALEQIRKEMSSANKENKSKDVNTKVLTRKNK